MNTKSYFSSTNIYYSINSTNNTYVLHSTCTYVRIKNNSLIYEKCGIIYSVFGFNTRTSKVCLIYETLVFNKEHCNLVVTLKQEKNERTSDLLYKT